MHLAPTEEQQVVQQEARRFLAAELTRARRLAWDDDPAGHDPAFWRAVAGLGWFGYGLPPAFGGEGASLVELGLLVEGGDVPRQVQTHLQALIETVVLRPLRGQVRP